MKYYYINLDRRPERNNNVIKQIKKSKILQHKIERFSAIDGRSLNIDSLPEGILNPEIKKIFSQNKNIQNHRYGISMTIGAIGCALSHYELYCRCMDCDEPFFILEDDIIIQENIDFYIENYIDNYNFDVLYLGFHRNSPAKIDNKHPVINKIHGIVWGTFGYIVTPKFCQYAVKNIFPIWDQIDTEIGRHITNNKITAMAFKNDIIVCNNFGTDIQQYIKNIPNSTKDYFNDVFRST